MSITHNTVVMQTQFFSVDDPGTHIMYQDLIDHLFIPQLYLSEDPNYPLMIHISDTINTCKLSVISDSWAV